MDDAVERRHRVIPLDAAMPPLRKSLSFEKLVRQNDEMHSLSIMLHHLTYVGGSGNRVSH